MMHQVPTETELANLFEDAWQAAELAGMSEDQHLVPSLTGLAEEILAWRNQRYLDRSETSVPRPGSISPSMTHHARGGERGPLRNMEMLLARQQATVTRLEQKGSRVLVSEGYQLLRIMQECLEEAHRTHGLILQTCR